LKFSLEKVLVQSNGIRLAERQFLDIILKIFFL